MNTTEIITDDVDVKVEKQSDDEVESETELYADHVVKEEIVIGPVVLQQPIYNTNLSEDAPLPKKPKLEIKKEKTDQVKSPMEINNDITSNVDFNENSTDIKTKEIKEEKELTKNYNQKHEILKNINAFKCNDCGEEFKNICMSEQNNIPSHEVIKQDNFKCKECTYQTETQDSFERHNIKLHDNDNFICVKSKTEYKLKSDNVHSDKINEREASLNLRLGRKSQTLLTLLPLQRDGPGTCTVNPCNANKFASHKINDKSIKDIEYRLKEKTFNCTVCKYKCSQKSDLTKHFRIHSGEKPFSCSFCNYKCSTSSCMRNHLRIHTNERPYNCSFCAYKCNYKSDLTKHLRIHTGIKPYSCPFCQYKCVSKSTLTRHLPIHAGTTLHSCYFCQYKCVNKATLTKHLNIHADEKLYSCCFCDYKSVNKSTLTKHLRIHVDEKKYPCSLCEGKSDSTKLLETQSDEERYSCSLCRYKFGVKTNSTQRFRTYAGKK